MDKCPYCGATQERPLFHELDKDGAVVQVDCESCGEKIKVTLKVVETYNISLPDKIAKKLRTVGQLVKKNPRCDWCICPAKAKCRCKTGVFEIKEVLKSDRAGSGWFTIVSDKDGSLEKWDSHYFLPAEKEVAQKAE